MDELGIRIEEAARRSGLSRSLIYQEIGAGRLRARKIGRATVILVKDLTSWLESRPDFGMPEGGQR